jgi:hypothetical protein
MYYFRFVNNIPFHKNNFFIAKNEELNELITIESKIIKPNDSLELITLTKVYPNFLANRLFRNIKNQELYEVMTITNIDCDDTKTWPITIVYSNIKSGKVYSRSFVEFLEKFTYEKFLRG